MTKELNNRILELKKHLYPNENQKLDKISLKKVLYQLLRESLKSNKHELNIGDYTINITPKNLSVIYESVHTTIEVSNNDIYYETIRDLETRFFCISAVKKDEFLNDTPMIKSTGIVTNIDGICEEHICLELYTDVEDNIKKYLSLPSEFKIIEQPTTNDYMIKIKREIEISSPRTDIIDLLDKNRVVPVYYDTLLDKYKTQVDRREYKPNNYSLLLPNLEDKKIIVSFLYSSMVDFYTEYMNKNN